MRGDFVVAQRIGAADSDISRMIVLIELRDIGVLGLDGLQCTFADDIAGGFSCDFPNQRPISTNLVLIVAITG